MADLGADSLDMVEIAMKSEEAFNFTLPDDQAEGIVTVEDLYEAVGTLLNSSEHRRAPTKSTTLHPQS